MSSKPEATVPFFSHPLVARLRRHHALEHATIHVLSQRCRELEVMGRTTLQGFSLYGDLPTEAVLLAAQHALQRLQQGQRELALHPTCGTNFAAAGVVAGLGVFAVLSPGRRGWKEWLGRLPMALVVATVGVMIGYSLGALIQAHVTTDPDVSGLCITGVVAERHGRVVIHRVKVEG